MRSNLNKVCMGFFYFIYVWNFCIAVLWLPLPWKWHGFNFSIQLDKRRKLFFSLIIRPKIGSKKTICSLIGFMENMHSILFNPHPKLHITLFVYFTKNKQNGNTT